VHKTEPTRATKLNGAVIRSRSVKTEDEAKFSLTDAQKAELDRRLAQRDALNP